MNGTGSSLKFEERGALIKLNASKYPKEVIGVGIYNHVALQSEDNDNDNDDNTK